MVSLEKAVAFVQNNGNAIEKARLSSIIWNESPSITILDQIAQIQGADGGFYYWIKGFSSICDTVYVIIWLDDLSTHKGPLVDRAVKFLIEHQQPDGGWDEVDSVRGSNSPPYLTPGEITTRVWLTAYCAHWFIRFGRAEPPDAKGCPTEFLLKHCEPSGRLKGYQRATWDSLVMFYYHPGPNSAVFKRTMDVIEAEFKPQSWTGSYLAWLLCCLRDANIPGEHPLVTRALDILEHKQRSDGSWESEDGEQYSVNATIEAIRVLKHYGRV